MVTGEEPGCLGAELERYAERARPSPASPPRFHSRDSGTISSMISYPPIVHFMIWGLGPYLALCTILDCFTGLQLLYSYSLSVVPLRASVYHVFSKYFLASGRRLFDPIAAYNPAICTTKSRSPTFSRRNSRRQPRPAAAAAVLSAGQLSEA
jgi:hypothetical protein